MADADVLLNKIKKCVSVQKQCARKFNCLADELEKTMKGANVTKVVGSSVSLGGAATMTVAGLLTFVTGGAALPVLAVVGAAGALASGTSLVTSIGSEAVVANKSEDAMKEAKQIVEELQELEREIQDLIKPLKPGAGEPSGSSDDDDGDGNIMEQLLRSEAKQQGLNLSHSVNLRRMCGLPKVNISGKIAAIKVLLTYSLAVLLPVMMLAGKKGGKKVAKAVAKRVASKAAGCVAGGAVGILFSVPELVFDCQNLDNCETEASKTLRENAEAVQTAAEEMEKELQIMREAVQKLVRIKLIIKKKNRSRDEKTELIQYVIKNTLFEVVRVWLIKNLVSEVFFRLLDLCNFIIYMVDEEKEKKKKKIDLIFVAHGEITDEMIPATCLWSLPSIIDVILYSPWNCLLTAEAAYEIAIGCIEPRHRKFMCEDPKQCPLPDSHHRPSPQRDHWNSMKDSKTNNVPEILVSPVGEPDDDAFPAFLYLEEMFGKPGEGRYVIPYLDTDVGTVPFRIIMLALSQALEFSEYEATVHLAACLGRSSEDIILDETYLKDQYCHTVDHSVMSVTSDVIYKLNDRLFNMMKVVFG